MSFWNFVKEVLPVAIPAAATIYGANQVSKANNQAAQISTQATQDATSAQLAGLEQAQENLIVNRNAASPGLLATQKIIARGSKLTPEQETAVADSRGQALNSLKGSSLRGSGRATAAIVSDVDNRVRNNFMAQNQTASDNAAKYLSSGFFSSNSALAGNQAQQGSTISKGLTTTGDIQASNTQGQAAIQGQAIGDVGALIADSLKASQQEKRDSSYERVE